MEVMRKLAKILLHINSVCSLVLLTVQVLDWYNPFMDFMGHALWVLYVLCIGTILLDVFAAFYPAKHISYKAVENRSSEQDGDNSP